MHVILMCKSIASISNTLSETQVIYAYIFMNDAFSLFPLYNISNIVIEIKVQDYIIQYTFSDSFDNEYSHCRPFHSV